MYEDTAKGLHTVGSTSALGAYVLQLDTTRKFTATPLPDRLLSIVKMVAEVTTITQQQTKTKGTPNCVLPPLPTTITVTPFVLDESTEDDTLIRFRFYHFAIDAKPAMFHVIYKELAIACGSKAEDTMKYFQILPQIIPVDGAPTWVLDVIVPAFHTLPTTHVYQYFTGNAVGGTVMLDFGAYIVCWWPGLTSENPQRPFPLYLRRIGLPFTKPLISSCNTTPTC